MFFCKLLDASDRANRTGKLLMKPQKFSMNTHTRQSSHKSFGPQVFCTILYTPGIVSTKVIKNGETNLICSFPELGHEPFVSGVIH